mmetsp:Transcript_184214/g.584065  ORF Transcript_184214/g.584065 Transcript_184214/m.584065 type:complete len:89 (+) Transcript_184214:810-1076(+)
MPFFLFSAGMSAQDPDLLNRSSRQIPLFAAATLDVLVARCFFACPDMFSTDGLPCMGPGFALCSFGTQCAKRKWKLECCAGCVVHREM